jgi:hypothetical protein
VIEPGMILRNTYTFLILLLAVAVASTSCGTSGTGNFNWSDLPPDGSLLPPLDLELELDSYSK